MGCSTNGIREILHSSVFRRRITIVSLTIQNASVVLITRYARSREGDMFFATTAVLMSELFKLITCFVLVFAEEDFSYKKFAKCLWEQVICDPFDCFLVSIPGVIYTLQNNLLFVGYSHLTAVSFQVAYQLKIFTTAIFFRLLLHKRLSWLQWVSLFILFVGVLLTQFGDMMTNGETKGDAAENPTQNSLYGFASVVLACTCSGFAGVYFEKLLKDSHKSVAIRNIQLAFFGCTASIVAVFLNDGTRVSSKGFFFGYDWVVWTSILIQSSGGLLIAATIRYADNIVKGFATSIAIVLTLLVYIVLLHFYPPLSFFIGSALVVTATILYSAYPHIEPTEA